LGNLKPSLIAAYGEPDRITIASNKNVLGKSVTDLLSGNLAGALPFSQLMGTRRPHLRLDRFMDPVIELDGLEVRFGERVILNRLKAALTGRSIGLLGPNGAGKSTLINTLLGFHKPAAGTARIFGRDIRTHAREVRSLVGYMPENDAFIAGMSGVRFVRLMAELAGLPRAHALERAHEAFFYVGLGEVRYRALGTYSLGMKQAAKLAQAIAHGPKLLFLDEPTNGLDPPARVRMIQLIQEIRDRGDLHLILSSHLLRDVEECCDEVLILKDGKVAAFCNLEEERRANRRFLEIETRGEPTASSSKPWKSWAARPLPARRAASS
jgi:ABC-2 type transport system ATP-binding protein